MPVPVAAVAAAIPAAAAVADLAGSLAPIMGRLLRGGVEVEEAHRQVLAAFDTYQSSVRGLLPAIEANDAAADAAAEALPPAAPPAPAAAPAPTPGGTP